MYHFIISTFIFTNKGKHSLVSVPHTAILLTKIRQTALKEHLGQCDQTWQNILKTFFTSTKLNKYMYQWSRDTAKKQNSLGECLEKKYVIM